MVGPLEAIAQLRKAYGDQDAWWPADRAYHERQGTDWRFEVCVGAILVQNTAWGNAERAISNLKTQGLLDARRLSRAEPGRVQEAIRPAGSHSQKTAFLRTFARHVANLPGGLDDLFRGPIKKQRELLLSFTGIGEETADVILVFAAAQASFVVDAYTRRLTKRLALGTGEEPYDAVQRLWSGRMVPSAQAFAQAHALLVEHGKARCTAKLPRCPGCPLERVCPKVGVEPEVFGRLP